MGLDWIGFSHRTLPSTSIRRQGWHHSKQNPPDVDDAEESCSFRTEWWRQVQCYYQLYGTYVMDTVAIPKWRSEDK